MSKYQNTKTYIITNQKHTIATQMYDQIGVDRWVIMSVYPHLYPMHDMKDFKAKTVPQIKNKSL